MFTVQSIKNVQVFSNGHFQSTRRTPWEGVEKSPAFKSQLTKALHGEIVKIKGREFRVVG